MKKFRFLEWKVYRDAQELFTIILRIVQKLPKEYRYEVGNQVVGQLCRLYSILLKVQGNHLTKK